MNSIYFQVLRFVKELGIAQIIPVNENNFSLQSQFTSIAILRAVLCQIIEIIKMIVLSIL